MASFIPIISEILPMIMPASTRVTTADELSRAEATSDNAVIEQAAVVDQCDSMCASGMLTLSLRDTLIRGGRRTQLPLTPCFVFPKLGKGGPHTEGDDRFVTILSSPYHAT